MTRTSILFAAAMAVAAGASSPALANDQLAASAGLSPAEAQGMSLAEIAQYKFNRNVSHSERQAVNVNPGSGGDRGQLAARAGVSPEEAGTMSLNALAVAKYNAEARTDDRQGPASGSGVTVISRSYGGTTGARSQLIASAGLTEAEAEDLTLAEIAQYKFNRAESHSDKQAVVR